MSTHGAGDCDTGRVTTGMLEVAGVPAEVAEEPVVVVVTIV